MPLLKQITPFVPVTDIEKTIAFFEKFLGFKATFRADGYAFIRRDNVALRLLLKSDDMDMHDPKRQQSVYIDVDNIKDLYSELKSNLVKLPEGRFTKMHKTFYGHNEFHVIDEDALLIMFGEKAEGN